MKLETILALRRPAGTSTAELAAAVRTAENSRRELLAAAQAAEASRKNVLLDDRALSAAERDGAQASLAAERLAAILPEMRADLDAARARDVRTALLTEHAEVEIATAELRRWQAESYPEIARLIGVGLRAQDAARTALDGFKANVAAAYESEAMRDGGPLGVTLSAMSEPMPRSIFPGWSA